MLHTYRFTAGYYRRTLSPVADWFVEEYGRDETVRARSILTAMR